MTIADVSTVGAPLEVPVGVRDDIRIEIERFYYLEAELLDDRRFPDWYSLFADDLLYFMPTRQNRTSREMDGETSEPGEVARFHDDKKTLGRRVRALASGVHWAEDPPSRTRHLVTNVRVEHSTNNPDEYSVKSNFLCYRNRGELETDIWAGERHDVLRNVGSRQWQVANRLVLLDQSVTTSINMSVFL